MAQQKQKTLAQLKASNDEAISGLDAAINTLAGLTSIQTERRKHDKQTQDQTVDAVDILDSRKPSGRR